MPFFGYQNRGNRYSLYEICEYSTLSDGTSPVSKINNAPISPGGDQTLGIRACQHLGGTQQLEQSDNSHFRSEGKRLY